MTTNNPPAMIKMLVMLSSNFALTPLEMKSSPQTIWISDMDFSTIDKQKAGPNEVAK